MTFIYVLQLKENKFYVGKTETPDKRLNCHKSGNGSAWTKKYKPIKTIELFEGDKYDEDVDTPREIELTNQNVISLPLKNARKVFEKNYLQSQINRFDGNISKTASFIGMERSALHRKLKQLGITEDLKK